MTRYLDIMEKVIKKSITTQQMTKREIEVMKYWFLNYNYREIATELKISENTVKTYIKSINNKLGGNSKMLFILTLLDMLIY